MILTVVFYMIVSLPGEQPRVEETAVNQKGDPLTVEECIGKAASALARIQAIVSDPREYRVGCAIVVPKVRGASH